jgi:hypothetical protein
MQPGVIIAILAILIPLWILLRRDFVTGLAFAIFFWVSMTTLLRIQLPGELPALTIHRLMLIVVAIAWAKRYRLADIRSVPLFGCFVFWVLANLISLLGTDIEFVASLKRFLDFVLEVFVFYVIASTSLKDQEDAVKVLKAAWFGLIAVAILAVVERQTGFNPVDAFIPGYQRDDGLQRIVLSTYQHRILLGTAMAIGVSLSFAVREAYRESGKRLRLFWVGLGLMLLSSYYAFSRGPWVGLALGCAIIGVAGSKEVRKILIIMGVLGMLALLSRPGVVETLTHYAKDSVDSSSFKGGTLQYRLELWAVAFAQVSKSTWLFLFGYGPGAGSEISIDWKLSYNNQQYVVDSWDNHFAYSLFQSGFIGLAATLLLYFKGVTMFARVWRRSQSSNRSLLACVIATASVLVWMMTNVLIFAKQIDYLFWTVIAAGFVIARQSETVEEEIQAPEQTSFFEETSESTESGAGI